MTQAIDALWRRFQSLDIIGKRALKSKVCELAYPATTSMCAPPEKMKTKGGVKKGKSKAPKGYDVYREPSYFEHVDKEYEDSQGSSKRVCTQQSQPSQPSSSQKQPSQKQPYQPSSSQKQPSQKQLSHKQPTKKYLEQFPKSIHPYIVDIVDVEPDGNCGFRAIASLLRYRVDGWPIVRRELDNELRNNISLYEKLFGEGLKVVRDSLLMSDRWFTIPTMGYLVANRYNVILVTLGKPSTTFCPMMTSHSSSSRFFCIGFVDGNHWVRVNSNFKLF
jgi:hypothetical protein